ncbi:hypothetical protein CS022_02170 [Veronia nyctiphanis]|uniref:DUF1521 domain-containing protein n=1 Tax=Veronia nyctiphanis TaxID=1278244 RepID=A0A4Q0YW15_9GAMM|nr:DUF1521 domain-containing protein [Veronia nyctiphanis]RXJ74434.1 hypothetical protein CS022_02170 [Veronia nyctiphanis]
MYGNNIGNQGYNAYGFGNFGAQRSHNLFECYYGDSSTSSVTDDKSKATWENDNYEIEFTESQSSMKITNKHTGEIYRVYSDPYIGLGDKDEGGAIHHKGEFKNDSVLILDDGTRIHMDTKPKGSQTFLDTVTIFEPNKNKATQITNLLSNENDLEIKDGTIGEFHDKTGVDYDTAVRFKEAWGEEEGLYVMKHDGSFHQIKMDGTAADNKAIIAEIEQKLKDAGYPGAAGIWGSMDPAQCPQFCDWINNNWWDQICHMFGNQAGVGSFQPMPSWPMPGQNMMEQMFMQMMMQYCMQNMPMPRHQDFQPGDLWALAGGAHMYMGVQDKMQNMSGGMGQFPMMNQCFNK